VSDAWFRAGAGACVIGGYQFDDRAGITPAEPVPASVAFRRPVYDRVPAHFLDARRSPPAE